MDISITINRRYRSFRNDFSVTGLSKFIALTGRNGVGKSQLLRMIERRQSIDRNNPECTVQVVINGEEVFQQDILGIFEWGMPSAPGAGMAEIQGYSQQVYSAITSRMGNGMPDESIFSRKQQEEISRISAELLAENYNTTFNVPDIDYVLGKLSSSFGNRSAQIINERIASIIYRWHFDALVANRPIDTVDNPISIFNSLCREFDSPYHISPFVDAYKSYVPLLENGFNEKVNWSELSSGEQVMFRIICWLFYYRVNNTIYPKLLLLDEPDAHLTPKMIHQLLKNLQEVVVDKMGIFVMFTTHSPNTVALSNESALYELSVSDDGTHFMDSINRKDALSKFSEGLLFVQEDTRLVFVEGKDDTPFYELLYRCAVNWHALKNIPSMRFIAASLARSDQGGCAQVLAMVPRFNGSSIQNLVHGLIDNDNSNVPQQNISVLERYSLESYLYDPLIIATSLIINSEQAAIPSIATVHTGDYQDFISNASLLQTAIDEVISTLKSGAEQIITDSGFGSEPVEVHWKIKGVGTDLTYTLPQWFLRLKKRDLLSNVLHSRTNPLKDMITSRKQFVAIESLGAIPLDIYETIVNIQTAS